MVSQRTPKLTGRDKNHVWHFSQVLFHALTWYWSQLQMDTARADCDREMTSWCELALDFEAATHTWLMPKGCPDGSKIAMKDKARLMATASRSVAKAHGTTLGAFGPVGQIVNTLKALGMPKTSGFDTKAKLLAKNEVNEALLNAATAIEAGHVEGWDWTPEWRSTQPKYSCTNQEQATLMPKQQARTYLNARELEEVEWRPEEEKILRTALLQLSGPAALQEKRRLLHNRNAEANGLHTIESPNIGRHKGRCVCRLCQHSVDRNNFCHFSKAPCLLARRQIESPEGEVGVKPPQVKSGEAGGQLRGRR